MTTRKKGADEPGLRLVGGTGSAAARGRILVVDDDGDLRSSLAALLRGKGYAVAQAADGEEALAAVAGPDRPDLVLLDAEMPGMSSVDVLRRMRARQTGVGVLVMTRHGTGTLAVRSIQLGAHGYLTKPLDPPEVLRAVGRFFLLRAAGAAGDGDGRALLLDAVALLLRREAERAERGAAEEAREVREMLIRFARAHGGSPGDGPA